MKLSISNAGIYNPIKYEIDDALSTLSRAKSDCAGSPGSFSCSGYVNGLSAKISEFIKKVNNFQYAVEKTEKEYNNFLMDKKQDFSNLNEQILKERVGLNSRFNNASKKYYVDGKLVLDSTSMLVFNQITGAASVVSKDLNNKDESLMSNMSSKEDTFSGTMETQEISQVISSSNIQELNQEINYNSINNASSSPDSVSGNDPELSSSISEIEDVPGALSPGTMAQTYQAKPYTLSDEEYHVLCATVYAEATEGNDYTYSDTMGVTSTILNRVEAGNWGGSSVTEVVSAEGQFNGYGYENEKFSNAMNDINCIPPNMMEAINDTLAGNRNTEGYSFVGNGAYNTFK